MTQLRKQTDSPLKLKFIRKKEGYLELQADEQIILKRNNILVGNKAGIQQTYPIDFQDDTIYANLGEYGSYTEKIKREGNQATGDIRLKVNSSEPFIIYCPFLMPKPAVAPYFMIPGFLYGSNNLKSAGGESIKFDYGGKIAPPVTPKIYTRADRSTHPGIITISNGLVHLVGIYPQMEGHENPRIDKWAPGYIYNGLMLDSSSQHDDFVGFSLGYEHFPNRYSWVWDNVPMPQNHEYLKGFIENCAGKTLRTQTFYFVDEAEAITDYGKALRRYYYQLHTPPQKRASRNEALTKIAAALVNDGFIAEHNYFYLCDNPDGRLMGNIAWTGGMQVAYPLLKASLQGNDDQAQKAAYAFIENLCEKAFNNQANLFFEEFRNGQWQITGWWGTRANCLNFGDYPLHSAYLNGQAAYYLLKAYVLTGRRHQKWLKIAEKVLVMALQSQNEFGAYPSFFDSDLGTGVNFEGFQSCWFVPGMTLLAGITGNPIYLKSAGKAIRYYHTWHQRGELYGTPMDTHDAVDEEGNLAFIIACVELHRLTKNNDFLELAQDGLNWEFSWKFAYNTPFTNDPLRNLNWSSCGGSITSTYIPIIHPMGNLIAGELYYLYQNLNDEYIADRLRDVCVWGLGTFNRFDGEFGFGKEGMVTEQFFYTDALCCPWWQPWDGGIWEAYLPWAAACILLSCAEDIPDSFFCE